MEAFPQALGQMALPFSPPLHASPNSHSMAPAGATASALAVAEKEEMAGEMLILKIFFGSFMLLSQREQSWPSPS